MDTDENSDRYKSYYIYESDGYSMSDLVIHNQFLFLLLSSIDKIRDFYFVNHDSMTRLVPVTDEELSEQTKTVFEKRQWSKVKPEDLIKLYKENGLIESQNLKFIDVMLINMMMEIFHNSYVCGLNIGISQTTDIIGNKTQYNDLNIDKLSGAEIKSKLYNVIRYMNIKSDGWNGWPDKSMQYIFGDLMIDQMIEEVIRGISFG
jgi:hypothetical protein